MTRGQEVQCDQDGLLPIFLSLSRHAFPCRDRTRRPGIRQSMCVHDRLGRAIEHARNTNPWP